MTTGRKALMTAPGPSQSDGMDTVLGRPWTTDKLEQTAMAATFYQREIGGPWIATAHTEGKLALLGLSIVLSLTEVYHGLTFETPA
jgi:hypothetical protein